MNMGFSEGVIFRLRSLYSSRGYTRYKMNKFEEYDLYARNKDFRVSDSVITFMDLNGKLMALKPDMTLSIVKNSRDDLDCLQKLYYNENVYRVDRNSRSFRELTQVGLECIGSIDLCCQWEVLSLAAQSLEEISPDWVLDVSNLGLLSDLIDALGIPVEKKPQALELIGGKNLHELTRNCQSWGVSQENISILRRAVCACGDPVAVLPELKALLSGLVDTAPLDELMTITFAIGGGNLRFDLSVVDDLHYYNGIVFKGFVSGLPESVLSGGRYDKLMDRMGRRAGAIGFAVYTDLLDRLEEQGAPYDVDVVLLYDDRADPELLGRYLAKAKEKQETVMLQRNIPENIRYQRLEEIKNGEVTVLENHA